MLIKGACLDINSAENYIIYCGGRKIGKKSQQRVKNKGGRKIILISIYNTSTNISKYPFTSDSMQSCKRNSRYKMNKKCNHED